MLCCVQSGETALYWAAWRGDVDIVQILINFHAAVDIRDKVTNLFNQWAFRILRLVSLIK